MPANRPERNGRFGAEWAGRSPETAGRPDRAGIVMGYAGLGEREVERAVGRLAAVLAGL